MRSGADGMKSGFFVTLPLLCSALMLVAAADYGGWIGSLARSTSLSLGLPFGSGMDGGDLRGRCEIANNPSHGTTLNIKGFAQGPSAHQNFSDWTQTGFALASRPAPWRFQPTAKATAVSGYSPHGHPHTQAQSLCTVSDTHM